MLFFFTNQVIAKNKKKKTDICCYSEAIQNIIKDPAIKYSFMEIGMDNILKIKKLFISYLSDTYFIEQLRIDQNSKNIDIEKLSFNFADEPDRLIWQINIAKIFFENNIQKCQNAILISEDGAFLFATEVVIKDNDNIVLKDIVSVSSDGKDAWKFRTKNCTFNKGKFLLQKNSFDMFGLSFPIFKIRFDEKFSSGFMLPSLDLDRIYGLVVTFPYYMYFNAKSDATSNVFIGYRKIGANFNYRFLKKSFIGYLTLDLTYFYDAGFEGIIHFRQKKIDDNCAFDFNIMLPTSRKYAQYWHYQNTFEKKSHIPSYWFYKNKRIRAGFNSFMFFHKFNMTKDKNGKEKDRAILDGTLCNFIPKFEYRERIKFKYFSTRIEFAFNPVFNFLLMEDMLYKCRQQCTGDNLYEISKSMPLQFVPPRFISFADQFKIENPAIIPNFTMHSNLIFALDSCSYKSGNYIGNTQCGMRIDYTTPAIGIGKKIFCRPFFIQTVHGYHSTKHCTISPYFKLRLIENAKHAGIPNNFNQYDLQLMNNNFSETLGITNTNTSLAFGIETFFKKMNCEFGYLFDWPKHYAILGVSYVHRSFFLASKAYLNRAPNFVFNIGCLRKKFNLNIAYLIVNYKEILHHKISSCILLSQISHRLSIQFKSVIEIFPKQELAQASLNFVFKNRSWIITFGIAYGDDLITNNKTSWNRPFLNFSITSNGIDKFKNACKEVKSSNKYEQIHSFIENIQ